MIISQVPMAKKYAKAYLNVYEHTVTRNDLSNMCKAATFLKEHYSFMELISDVGVEKKEIVSLLSTLSNHFNFSKSLHKLILVLTDHKHISYLLEVLQDICCLYKSRHKILELKIKTAHSLDSKSIKELELFVAKHTQQYVTSTVEVDQSLIAGVRLQSNFYLWDYSIASRLIELQQKLFAKG